MKKRCGLERAGRFTGFEIDHMQTRHLFYSTFPNPEGISLTNVVT